MSILSLEQGETSNTEDERKELEEKLKELVQHNHPVPLIYNPDSGMIVQASSACGCKTPRFGKVCVKVEQPEEQKPLLSIALPPPEFVYPFFLDFECLLWRRMNANNFLTEIKTPYSPR